MNDFIAHILVVDDDDGIRSLIKKFLPIIIYLIIPSLVYINIMKKIFKKLFSVERIDLIKQYLNKKNPIFLEIGVHRGDFSKKLFLNR